MAVFEELGRGDAALAFSLSMHNAVAAAVAGHPDLGERWGRALAAGDGLGGFSLTEPHAGSDATAITTRAEPDGDGWRVTGRKAWVSLAGEADLFLVVCKTSAEPGHRDIAIVAVERAAAGVSFPVIYRKACADVPPDRRDGARRRTGRAARPARGRACALLSGAIDVARCDIAAIAAGLHAEALDTAVAYAARAAGLRRADPRPRCDPATVG